MNNKALMKAAIAGGLDLIPVVSSIQTTWNTYFQSQSEERRQQVEKEFSERLENADEQISKAFEKINENPANFAIFLNSIKNAHEDISQEKIKLYINILFNAINNSHIKNAKIHIFLNLLRKYSILHIKTLQYFNSLHKDFSYIYPTFQTQILMQQRSSVAPIIDVIKKHAPEITDDIPLLETVIHELNADNLLKINKLEELNIIPNTIQSQTTPLGAEFLNFISE